MSKYKDVVQVLRAVARRRDLEALVKAPETLEVGGAGHNGPAEAAPSSDLTTEIRSDAAMPSSQPSAQLRLPDLVSERNLATGSLPSDFKGVYEQPIPSTRSGALFNAHSYPTKINTLAVMACILAHTEPGDVVFDGFAGSGATGLAATLCGKPDPNMRALLDERIPGIEWGERNAVLYDLSELAAFIGDSLLNAPDPVEFESAASALLQTLENELGWMYQTTGPDGREGDIRHILWTEHLVCPNCGEISTFWESAVEVEPARIRELAKCESCLHQFKSGSAERLTETYEDNLLGVQRERRVRTPAFVYGISGRTRWKRPAQTADFDLLERIDHQHLPTSVPIVRMMNSSDSRWGYMHRSGYHFGIEYVHDFYTRRNLMMVSRAWELIESFPEALQGSLKFWISSYNASHSTLMTRVVCKKSSEDFVLSGAQPGALYIGGLPVEKNVILGLRRKLRTIKAAFAETRKRTNRIQVTCGSSLKVDLPDASVDYIFTDPPFGDNIQYSEVNFLSEAWLDRFTRAEDEAIVSPTQGKSVSDYGALLKAAFSEAFRLLKPGKFMTVAFHSTQPDVWEALRDAWEAVGFDLVTTSILDKEQTSFKQTTTEGAVQKDPLILLQKPATAKVIDLTVKRQSLDHWHAVESRLLEMTDDPAARSKRHLFSYLVTFCLERGLAIPYSANEFYKELDNRFSSSQGIYEPRS